MGNETSGPDRPHMMPGRNKHLDAAPASRPGLVDDKPFEKCPNGLQKVNHEISESYPDDPDLVPRAEKPLTEEPGDATISPPCPLTDSRTATANTAAPETVPNSRAMSGPPPTVPTHAQLSKLHPAEMPQ